jgi:ParB-like chromosome segregation protein Spo0J
MSEKVRTLTAVNSRESVAAIVPLDSLRPGYSPRLAGEDAAHAQRLAELDTKLPRILVHRSTMRIIDGMHRYRAATLRGAKHIEVEFFDGSEEMAFVRAVEANVAHGLPLSYADREAAAIRIIASHPEWSDRAIAASTGLAARTVRSVRVTVSAEKPQVNARLGLDGRVRPLDSSAGRSLAYELIKERPEAPLREIARRAGIAVSTAHDVRERVRRGEDPVPDGVRRKWSRSNRSTRADRTRRDNARSPMSKLRGLQMDPALRFTEAGRVLLGWLSRNMVDQNELTSLADSVPPHCVNLVADLARDYAFAWHEFSEELGRRGPVA